MADISLKASLEDKMSDGLENIAEALGTLIKLSQTQVELQVDSTQILDAINTTMQLGKEVEKVGTTAPTLLDMVKSGFASLGGSIQSFLNPMNLIPNILGIVSTGFNGLLSVIGGIGNLVSSAILLPFQAVGTLFNAITGTISGVVSAFGEVIFFLGNLGQAFDTLLRFAQPIINLFTSIKDAIISSISVTADFEKQISNVASVTGASAEDMKKLSDAALKVGADTSLSSSQAAEALYSLGSAGYQTADAIGALNGVAKLSEATQADLAKSTEIVVSTLNQFKMQATEATDVANIFAAGCNVSMLTVDRLGDSLKYVGPVAGTMGISLEKTVGALAALSNAGFQGEQAGTILRSAISNLINPAGQAGDALSSLGIKTDELTKMFTTSKETGINPFAAVLDLLKEKGATTQQMMQIFGETAGPGMLNLLDQGGQAIRDYQTQVTGTQAAFDAAKVQLDNYKGSLLQLSGSYETLQIVIGQAFQNALKLSADALTAVVNSITTFIQSTGLSVAAGQLMTGTVQLLLQSLSLLSPVMVVINNALTAMGTIISTTVAAVMNFIVNNTAFQTSFTLTQKTIDLLSVALKGFVAALTGLSPAILTTTNSLTGLQTAVTNYVNQLLSSQQAQASFKIIIDSIMNVIKSLSTALSTITISISQFIGSFNFESISNGQVILQNLSTAIQGLSVYIADSITKFAAWASEFIKSGQAWETLKNIFNTSVSVIQGLINVMMTIPNIISNILPSILTLTSGLSEAFVKLTEGNLSGAITQIFDTITTTILNFIAGISNNSTTLVNAFTQLFDGLKNAFTNIKTNVIEPALNQFKQALQNGLVDSLKEAALKVTETIKVIGTALNNGLKDVFNNAKSIGQLLSEAMNKDITDAATLFSPITEVLKQGIQLITTTINEGLPIVKEAIISMIKNMLIAMEGAIDFLPVSDKMKEALKTIIDVFETGLDTGKIAGVFKNIIPPVITVLNEVFKQIKQEMSVGLKEAIVGALDTVLSAMLAGVALWGITLLPEVAATFSSIGAAISAAILSWPILAGAAIVGFGVAIGQYLINQGLVWAGYLTSALATAGIAIVVGISAWPALAMGAIAGLGLAIYNYLIGHSLIDDIPMWFKAVFDNVASYFGTVGATLLKPFEAIWSFIKETTTTAIDIVSEVANSVIEAIVGVFTDGAQIVSDSFIAIWNFMGETINTVISYAKDIGNAIINAINDIIIAGKETLTDSFNAIWDILSGMVSIVTDIGTQIGDGLINALTSAIETGKALIEATLNDIVSMAESIYSRITDIVNNAKSAASGITNLVTTGSLAGGETIQLGEMMQPMATGGIIPATATGTPVLAAESGLAEAFVPLPDGKSIPVSFNTAGLGSTNNSNINISFGNITINNKTDEREFLKQIESTINDALIRKNGRR